MPPRARQAAASTAVDSGTRVLVSGSIFNEPHETYPAVVLRPTPRRANAYDVRFDADGSVYWFPANDVEKWAAAALSGRAGTSPATPAARARRAAAPAPASTPTTRRAKPANRAAAPVVDLVSTPTLALAMAGLAIAAGAALALLFVRGGGGGDDRWRLPW